jgi:hypothetical protein
MLLGDPSPEMHGDEGCLQAEEMGIRPLWIGFPTGGVSHVQVAGITGRAALELPLRTGKAGKLRAAFWGPI